MAEFDDRSSEKRQPQIVEVVELLSQFNPIEIAVEAKPPPNACQPPILPG